MRRRQIRGAKWKDGGEGGGGGVSGRDLREVAVKWIHREYLGIRGKYKIDLRSSCFEGKHSCLEQIFSFWTFHFSPPTEPHLIF